MFQNSVLNTIKQDEGVIALRWAAFQGFLSKVDAIRGFKEEEYQDGFLQDVFESCLGYTLKTTNPDSYTLSREAKNETDSKKADGAIWSEGKVVGVIELKAQNTTNLDKATDQAFNYLVSNSEARYVIVSNFNELRFYIDKKTQFQKFNLFSLSYEEFKLLHLLISYESISEGIPLRLKNESNSFEEAISKKLYRDFSTFRLHLFQNLIANNQDKDKSLLLRLTQKLCDRIIFILFAEDRGLLRANSIKEIREDFREQKFTNHSPYNIYKFYFDAINEGNERLGIPKYNGGLFAKDEILDSLIIDDGVLDDEVQKLSDYDFESEVSVNILGHIFEQSLTDLEELQASIENNTIDKTQTKRKKDGVFYTPEYITRYIVDNTLGKLCHTKRQELNLTEITPPKNPKKPTKKEQQTKANLELYRDWLLNIKILDPACGSGAFLNQALDHLIGEHKTIQDNLVTMGDITAYYEIEKSILENNLYGVDINEDATEIAKLSLWLKTAQKGRELTQLADKIKVGNSLIDDKSVVDNAFVWEEEFKEVFKQGGFDIVIGNPPYVRQELLAKEAKEYFKTRYTTYQSTADLYVFFIEKGMEILKDNGKFSYIFPNKWLKAKYGKPLREWLQTQSIEEIIDFGDLQAFEGATTYPVIMTLTSKEQLETFDFMRLTSLDFSDLKGLINQYATEINPKQLSDDGWQLVSKEIQSVLDTTNQKSVSLGEYIQKVKFFTE